MNKSLDNPEWDRTQNQRVAAGLEVEPAVEEPKKEEKKKKLSHTQRALGLKLEDIESSTDGADKS